MSFSASFLPLAASGREEKGTGSGCEGEQYAATGKSKIENGTTAFLSLEVPLFCVQADGAPLKEDNEKAAIPGSLLALITSMKRQLVTLHEDS